MTDSQPPTRAELRRTGRMLTIGTWILIGAVSTFSAMTGAQFIGVHCHWRWSGWVLAAAIDIAFVMALQADATLARYGANGGNWPAAFRWLTGAFSVFVNTGDAALAQDLVGIAVHLIAPALLLVLGEAGPAWRRHLASLDTLTTHHTVSAMPPEPDTRTTETAHTRHEPPSVRAARNIGPDAIDVHTTASPPASAEEARIRIIEGRMNGLSQRETARRAHRSPAYVRKIWSALEHTSNDARSDSGIVIADSPEEMPGGDAGGSVQRSRTQPPS